MTTPIDASVLFEAPLANPLNNGLYLAGTVRDIEDPTRLGLGVKVITRNCGSTFTWPLECSPDPEPQPKTGSRPDDATFHGSAVGAADECGLRDRADAEARALQSLRLRERELVEEGVAAALLAAAGAPLSLPAGPEPALVRAVGLLEEALGALPGVIHARGRYAASAAHYALVTATPSAQRSPLGHAFAFGTGYAALGATLVATGPVVVHRGPVQVTEGLDPQHNTRLVIAEREVVVTWECGVYAVALS